MENDIIDALEDVGYTGPIVQEEGTLEKALEGGPKSVEFTLVVEWISNELKSLCNLEEHVNAISSPEDSSAFLLELSSFLKELGCAYSMLTSGHVSDRLNSRKKRLLLLDYLLSELEAARMISLNKPDTSKMMQVQLSESSTASDLKNMLIALKFPKPPTNITPGLLFKKVEQKMKEVIAKAPPELVGKPLFTGVLSDKQWQMLGDLQEELLVEYRMRRELLIKRLDVTIQSFQWSDRIKARQDEIASMFLSRRKNLCVEPDVHLSDLLAAREDLAVIEKTSSASVRKNTQSSVNKVIIGRVPDRGGRPSEQQPPPPEMPSWQQNRGFIMFGWLRRFIRRTGKPIQPDVAYKWHKKLSILYAILAWHALGGVIYMCFTGRADWAKYYGLKKDEPGKRYSEQWAELLGIEKAHVIQLSGFRKVGEYDIDTTKDSSDVTENSSDVTENTSPLA